MNLSLRTVTLRFCIVLVASLGSGCSGLRDRQLENRIELLERRIDLLEKRLDPLEGHVSRLEQRLEFRVVPVPGTLKPNDD